MRFAWAWEHVSVVVALLVVSFCIADEEPILDWSDLNLVHVWVMVLCALVTYFDLVLRARYGQLVAKDTTSAAAAFTFVWGLENYTRLVLLVFCAHNLMPLEVDLVETIELYQAWGAWVVGELLPTGVFLTALLGLALTLNLSLASGSATLIYLTLVGLCVGHLVTAVLLAWDLVTAGFSSVAVWEEVEVFYLQPKSALTFDRALGVGDQFEWHRERTWPYSLRFEDLYFFFFQLLLVWDLLCSLFFWACVTAMSLMMPGRAVSYTQVGLGLVWLEHVCLAVAFAYVGLLVVGLRVWLHTPGEFSAFWW